MSRRNPLASALLLAALLAPASGQAAEPPRPFVPTLLQRVPLSGHETLEGASLTAVLAPQASTGWHLHPGDEYAILLEGQLEIRYRDREARVVRAGEAYHNARGVVHETVNTGSVPARIASTFVVDRGAPIVQPAP